MKRVIQGATKRVNGDKHTYTGIKDLVQLLKDAGFDQFGYRTDAAKDDKYVSDIKLISGPAEVSVHNGYIDIYQGDRNLFHGYAPYLMQGDESAIKRYESIARAEASSLDKLTDPEYQKATENARKLRQYRKLSTSEIVDNISSSRGVTDYIAQHAINDLRYSLSDADWLNYPNWYLSVIDTTTEGWASTYVQGYGYTYKYVCELDTGRNTYTTTVYRSEGWHTE